MTPPRTPHDHGTTDEMRVEMLRRLQNLEQSAMNISRIEEQLRTLFRNHERMEATLDRITAQLDSLRLASSQRIVYYRWMERIAIIVATALSAFIVQKLTHVIG